MIYILLAKKKNKQNVISLDDKIKAVYGKGGAHEIRGQLYVLQEGLSSRTVIGIRIDRNAILWVGRLEALPLNVSGHGTNIVYTHTECARAFAFSGFVRFPHTHTHNVYKFIC